MYWQKRLDREPKDQSLQEKILEIRAEHKAFGYRRIWGLLRQTGLLINKKRVQRIVQKLSLQVTSYTRKSRKYNSYKGTVGKVAPNRLRRRFETSVAHQKIVTDTTEFKYYERDINGKVVLRKAYLDPFLDLYNREVISYHLRKAPTAAGIMSALEQAIKATADCKYPLRKILIRLLFMCCMTSNGICRGFPFKYGKFPLPLRYCTALSVPKVPTHVQ